MERWAWCAWACMCARARLAKLQLHSKPSLIHDCIIPGPNLSVSIYGFSLIPGHVGIHPHAATVWGAAKCRRLILKWWVLLPETQPTYSSCCRCWGKDRRKKVIRFNSLKPIYKYRWLSYWLASIKLWQRTLRHLIKVKSQFTAALLGVFYA